jgi:hypothetical protein
MDGGTAGSDPGLAYLSLPTQICFEGDCIDAGEVVIRKTRALYWCGEAGNGVMNGGLHLQVRTELTWTTWEF